MRMTKCDFCVYGTICDVSTVEGSQRQYQYVIGSDECKEAARAFTQYMMTKERFKDLVYMMLEHNELYDKLYDLGIDTINCKYLETAGVFFDELMRTEFGVDGADLVSWWMYEDVDHKIYAANQEEEILHGEVIADLNNIDDLYTYLTEGGRDAVEGED